MVRLLLRNLGIRENLVTLILALLIYLNDFLLSFLFWPLHLNFVKQLTLLLSLLIIWLKLALMNLVLLLFFVNIWLLFHFHEIWYWLIFLHSKLLLINLDSNFLLAFLYLNLILVLDIWLLATLWFYLTLIIIDFWQFPLFLSL